MVAVRLREWDRGDAAAIASVLIDPQVLKWSHIAELGVERWIAEQREGRRGPSMAVCDAGDEHVLGKVALRLPGRASPATSCDAIGSGDHPVGELSYWVLPHARGRGVATAAVVAMLDLAREAGEVRAVVLDIEADNVPSIRVAQRVGATVDSQRGSNAIDVGSLARWPCSSSSSERASERTDRSLGAAACR